MPTKVRATTSATHQGTKAGSHFRLLPRLI